MLSSEFADEYQEWLEGSGNLKPPTHWFNRTLAELNFDAPLAVSPDTNVAAVVELMNARRQTAALVLEGDELAGIFTERDVLTRVVLKPLDPRTTPVRALMTSDPHTLTESTQISAALRILALANYHHLPVLDDAGKPKAIVSLDTVVRFLLDAFPREIMNAPPAGDGVPKTQEGA